MNLNIELRDLLQQELSHYALSDLTDSLVAYLNLLSKWNQAYNLTAIRDPREMIYKHFLDSLAILPWISDAELIDVGTGPGLPGIPLALARPELPICLLDSNGKKTRFLSAVQRELGLKNIEIIQSRIENYQPSSGFATVVSRAFSNLKDFTTKTQHLIKKQGQWVAMKGRYPQDELEQIHHPYRVEPYTVAGITGERCCVIINNN